MRVFCVPSHKSICATPLLNQGVLLTPQMLEQGVWFLVGGGTIEKDDEYQKKFELQRSDNEAAYKAALGALLEIFNQDQRLMAVVSMRWCSFTYRLVTAKRVWLSLYCNNRQFLTYNERVQGSRVRALYNFLDYWENPEYDQKVWSARFSEAIRLELELAN